MLPAVARSFGLRFFFLVLSNIWIYLASGYIWMYLDISGYIWIYLDNRDKSFGAPFVTLGVVRSHGEAGKALGQLQAGDFQRLILRRALHAESVSAGVQGGGVAGGGPNGTPGLRKGGVAM